VVNQKNIIKVFNYSIKYILYIKYIFYILYIILNMSQMNNSCGSNKKENFCILGLGDCPKKKENFSLFGIGNRKENCCCIVDCDSGSKSIITNSIHNKTFNKNAISILTNNVTNTLTSAIVKSTQSTSAAASAYSKISTGTLNLAGDDNDDTLNFSVGQNIKVDVKAIQKSISSMDLSSVMANSIAATLRSHTSADNFQKLYNDAKSSDKSSFGSVLDAPTSSTSDVNNHIWNTTTSDVERNFTQLVKNNISTKSAQESLKTCSANLSQTSLIDIEGINAYGSHNKYTVNFNVMQKAVETLSCDQFTEDTKKQVISALNAVGIKTNDTSTTENTNELTNKAESEAHAGGLPGVIKAVGEAISNFFGAWTKPLMYVAIACIIACCLSSIASIVMMILKNRSSSSSDDSDDTGDDGGDNGGDAGDAGESDA
jgi:hypothetical protein